MTVGVENVDKAIARARHVVVFFLILFCIGYKEIAINVLDAERRETGRNVRIGEVAVDLLSRRRPEAGRPVGGEHVNRSGPKVRSKKKDAVNVGAENKALVNRVRRVVDGKDCLISRGKTAAPSRNRAVFGVEDECGRQVCPRDEKARRRVGGWVPHEAGGRRGRWVRRILRVDMLTGGGNTAVGQRDLDPERRGLRLRHPLAIVKRRAPRGVVGDPEGTGGRRERDAPRILQHRVCIWGYAGEIRGQIGDYIAIWPIAPIFAVVGASASSSDDADRDECGGSETSTEKRHAVCPPLGWSAG